MRAVVVLLDVSASMNATGVFAEARDEARRAMNALRVTDRLGLILFSDRASGVAPPSTNHDLAKNGLAAATVTDRAGRLAPALLLASDWLARTDAPAREVVVVTDGQKNSLTGAQDVSLPEGTTVTVKTVSAKETWNAAITTVTLDRVFVASRENVGVAARVAVAGLKPGETKSLAVGLEMGGRVIEEKRISIGNEGTATISFAHVPLPQGETRARVLMKDDSFPADNVFHFVIGATGDVHVVLVDDAPYTARALAIGTKPRFVVKGRRSIERSDLAGADVVFVNGDRLPPSSLAALTPFVEKGGGLVVALGGGSLSGEEALLGGAWSGRIDRLGDHGGSLGFIDLDHPALLSFRQARSGDFSRARFLKYRALRSSQNADGPKGKSEPTHRVIARFDDGREALIEKTLGQGRVVVFAGSLDGVSNDLPLQPVFLPLVHELTRYVAQHRDAPSAHKTGEAWAFSDHKAASDTKEMGTTFVRTPAGRREKLPDGGTAVELLEAGFYEIEPAGAPAVLAAANVDPTESDLSFQGAEEIASQLHRTSGTSSVAAQALSPDEQERQQKSWKWILSLALILLLIEPSLSAQKRATPIQESQDTARP